MSEHDYPDLHPGNIRHRHEAAISRFPQGEAILKAAEATMSKFHATIGALATSTTALHGSALGRTAARMSVIDPSTLDKFNATAGKLFDKAAAPHEAALNVIRSAIHERDLEIGAAIGAKPQHGAEIRSHAKALDDGARTKLIADAIAAGDRETIGAILDGPAYLAGITVNEQEAYRAAAAQRLVPDAVAARTAYVALEQHLEAAGRLFVREAKRLADQVVPANVPADPLAAVRAVAEA